MVVFKYFPFGLSISHEKKEKQTQEDLFSMACQYGYQKLDWFLWGSMRSCVKGWWISRPCFSKHYVNQAISFPRSLDWLQFKTSVIYLQPNTFSGGKLCSSISQWESTLEWLTWVGMLDSKGSPVLSVLCLRLPMLVCSINFSSISFRLAFHPIRGFFESSFPFCSPGLITLQ